jgi:hypothetical protein
LSVEIKEHHGRIVKTTGDGLLLYCAMILEAALAQDVYTG